MQFGNGKSYECPGCGGRGHRVARLRGPGIFPVWQPPVVVLCPGAGQVCTSASGDCESTLVLDCVLTNY